MLDYSRRARDAGPAPAQEAGKARLSLRIPEPAARPGEPADFSKLRLSDAGTVRRPAVDSAAESMRDLAYELIRVLDDSGAAVGPIQRLRAVLEQPATIFIGP